MTYADLLKKIEKMNSYQLSCHITIEDPYENECYPAELRIAGSTHDSLDEGHPVLYLENWRNLLIPKDLGDGGLPPSP